MDPKSHLDGKEPAPQGESAAASSVTPVHRAIAQRLVAKLHVKQRIEQVIASGKLAEATTQIHQALTDYPNDADIVALEDRVRQARERGIQAYQLMEEGRQLCDDQKFEEGIEVLRSAHSIDEHDPQVRSALIDNLLCYSLAVLETNVALAEKLAQEASALDPKHPVNQSVIDSIQEYKRSVPVQDAARPPLRVITAKTADAPLVPLPRRVEAMPSALAQPAPPPPKAREPVPNRSVFASTLTVERPRNVPAAGSSMAPAPTIVPSLPIVHASPEERSETASGKATGAVRRKNPPRPDQVPASPSSRVGAAPNGQTPVVTDTQGKKTKRKPSSIGSPKLWTWAAGALVGAAVLAGLLFKGVIAGRQATPAPTTVSIRTTPPGAIVHINGEAYDITHPVLLRPGSYHLEASLDGFRPAVQDVDITSEAGAPIDIHLVPVAPMLQIATDLRSGTVTLDGQAAGDLANGQFAVASLAPGGHLLRVASGSQAEAVIQFAISPAGPPVITNVVGVKNLSAVIVGSYGEKARVYASFGPATVRVDGNIAGTVAPAAPVSIENLSASSHELVLDEGKTQHQLAFDIGVTTGLFVSLSADRNVGALEIASNEPGFDVRIDGKAAKVSTRRGRYFVDNVDAKSATVQVSKAGFDAVPAEQVVNVRKGATSRVIFKLSAIPTQATVRLADLLPGTHVVLDEHAQQLQSDGSLQANVAPGEHTVELTRPGYKPKVMRFSAKAGQLIAFSGSEVSLKDTLTGMLSITSRVPASAVVLLRKEGAEYAVSDHDAEVPEGLYTLVAKASGFRDEVRSVKIFAETPVALDIKLTPIAQPVRMEGWDNTSAWKKENGWYSRKGGEFVMFKGSAPTGTVEFVARRRGRSLPLFKGGQVRWITNYVDASNYDLYELDGQKLTWSRIVNGKATSSKQAPHGVKIKDDTYRVMVEVGTPQTSGKFFDGASWRSLPALAAAAPNAGGRFGFYLPGNDEILLSDFIFKPTE